MNKILIKCKTEKRAPLDEFVPLQGNLKYLNSSNERKLKKQMVKHGFTCPFFATLIDDVLYLLDGHQRLCVLKEMRDSRDYILPDRFPYVEVIANSIEDAKEKLLAITSQYGKITEDSFYTFTDDLAELDSMDSFSFDAFDFKDIPGLDDPEEETQHNQDKDKPPAPEPVIIACPKCGHKIET